MQPKINSTTVAMEPRLWLAFLEDIRQAQDNRIVFAAKSTPAKSTPAADVVNISGVLMRRVPAAYKDYGLDMTGYDEIAEAVNTAAASRSEAIILNISSGGGMTDGIDTAIEAIRAAKEKKPVYAYADGMVASAAYWLASQADKVFATRLTEVGGVGVYSVMYDTSGAMKDKGIEAVVARSGSVKGAGISGDAITDEMRAVEQEIVDEIAEKFFADVAANRIALDKELVMSGRTWLGEMAAEINLVDGVVKNVSELPDAITALTREAQTVTATDEPEPQPKETFTMSEEIVDAGAIVTAERNRVMAIQKTFASDPDFAMKHINAGSTLDAAKAEHYDIMQARNEALAAMAAESAAAPMKNSGEASEQNAPTGYFARMKEIAAEKGIGLPQAAAIAARENPEAYHNECFPGGR